MDREHNAHTAACVAANSAMLLLSKGQDLQSIRGHDAGNDYEHDR